LRGSLVGMASLEQPACFRLAFAIDRVKALAPKHPEWTSTQAFKAALEGGV
jgi:hypothetical protein